MVAWEGFEEDMREALAFRHTPEYARYLDRFARWLDAQGIDDEVESFAGSPPRCAVLIPRVLQPNADRVDRRRYRFVGPTLDRRPGEGEWPIPERPLVLVSLGSAYHDRPAFWRACVAAFSRTSRTLAPSCGVRAERQRPPTCWRTSWSGGPAAAALRGVGRVARTVVDLAGSGRRGGVLAVHVSVRFRESGFAGHVVWVWRRWHRDGARTVGRGGDR